MSAKPHIKLLKILIYVLLTFSAVALIIFFIFALYLAIPGDNLIHYQDEILAYENTSILDSNELPTALSPIEITDRCQTEIINIKKLNLDDISSEKLLNENLVSATCKKEIDEASNSLYQKEINEACNYGVNLTSFFSFFDKLDSSEKKLNKTYQEIKLACNAGSYAYRAELNQYLSKNLTKIDAFSHYIYLKIIEKLDNKKAWGKFASNGMQKLKIAEETIKQINRFIFISHTLKEIHEEKKTVNELDFDSSPLKENILGIIEKDIPTD